MRSDLPSQRESPLPLVVLGATAVGKTALLLEAVRRLSDTGRASTLEVVSADSRQVYRGLSIGTAKPDESERAVLPHHLIDICDPAHAYSAAEFAADAQRACAEIAARGATPVLAGGTGFYLRAVLYGLSGTPPSNPEIRAALEREADERGLNELRGELAHVDPESAAAIGPNDRFRIIRALEIFRSSGRPRSSFRRTSEMKGEFVGRVIGLRRAREQLHERIDRRIRKMFERGLAGEVERLVASGYGHESPGLQTIGYREFFDEDGSLRTGEIDREEVARAIAQSTRAYVRRQETFFRSMHPIDWFDAEDPAALEAVIAAALDTRGAN